jgi:hypothetical protein
MSTLIRRGTHARNMQLYLFKRISYEMGNTASG